MGSHQSSQSSQSSRWEREERERARWNNYREATSSTATARDVEVALEQQRKLYEQKVKEVVNEQQKKLQQQQQKIDFLVVKASKKESEATTTAKQPPPSTLAAREAPSTSAATARDVEVALEQQRQLYEQKMKELMNEQQKKQQQQKIEILFLNASKKESEATTTAKQPSQPTSTAKPPLTPLETSTASPPCPPPPSFDENCKGTTSSLIGSLERQRTPYSYNQNELHGTVKNLNSPGTLYPHLGAFPGYIGPLKPSSPITHGGNYNAAAGVYVNNPFSNNQQVPQPQPAQRPTFMPSAPPSDAPSTASTKLRSRPHSRQRNQDDDVKCPTCGKMFGERIYQCNQGHSSCQLCKLRQVPCGQCRHQITDRRNFDLEKYILERKVKCPNSADGCCLYIKMADMEEHAKKCPFKAMQCPSLGLCRWNGKISQLANHFEEMHQTHLQAEVDKEMFLSNICDRSHTMHYIRIGPFNFLVHIVVSDADRRIYMAVQLIGSKQSAAKWDYEIHIYKKNEPRKKYQYIDKCLPASEPIQEILKDTKCAVIPLQYANTFICGGVINYKFYIKKNEIENPNNKKESTNSNFVKKENGPRTYFKKNYVKKNKNP